MPLPFVTIVMATLDAAEYLPESLASIAAQTYDHHELVVVDGGSTDGTCEILAGFPRARVIRQQSTGFANAWNEGIAAARGDCITFLDSDDRWRPQALAAHAERLASGADASVGRMRFFLDPGRQPPPGFKPSLLEGDRVAFMPGCFAGWRRVFDTVGLFETNWKIAADIVWFAKLRESGLLLEPHDTLVLEKRVHDANLSYVTAQTPVYRRELLQLLRDSLDRRRAG
ncbi:MAG: glycosyltransferase [Planctomycetia bacterium]|nr:glycosyltransferase [Planctomycetia bacterium]